MAYLQNFVDKFIWPVKHSSWTAGDHIFDINGNVTHPLFSYDNDAGEIVTQQSALRVSTVYTCVNVRGNTIASLPCNVIQEADNKKTVLTDHPAYYLIAHEPNSYMTVANFWKTVMLHVDIWGNAFAYINRTSRQRPKSLDLWEPWNVTITFSEGDVWYAYNGADPVPSRDVLHYRFYTWDGICGRSPVLENRNTIGMAMKLDRFSSKTLASQPNGIYSYEGLLTPEQVKENEKQFKKFNQGQPAVLSRRWAFQAVMNNAEQAEFIAAKKGIKQELCGIWQVPPTFIQDLENATFSNAEQMDLVYAKHTVTPICRNIELENNMKLFFESEKSNTYTKFNMNGLLRGDIAARQSFYQSMVNTGVMNRNEARSYEDLNPYPDGDNFLVQGAMVPADLLREKYKKELLAPVEQPKNPKLNGHAHVN